MPIGKRAVCRRALELARSTACAAPLILVSLLGTGCGRSERALPAFALTSPAFANGDSIPILFTCDGANQSPPLSWSGSPARTVSYVLIVDDPDAKGFVHWLMFDIPAPVKGVPQGIAKQSLAPAAGGAKQGQSGFAGPSGYNGPCPPSGAPHHYRFQLYALDTTLTLPPGATRDEVEAQMRGHQIARGELTGTYARQRPTR